jgi:catechol 2,3-dioxygenase-like lactoylglutathione lyase family enzyme
MLSAMLESLDHVILAVRDLAAATGQYARLLARTPSWRGSYPGQGTANTLFRLDNTYLELLAVEGAGPTGDALRGFLKARGEALVGLAFGTPDAEACRSAWVDQGLSPGPIEEGLGRDVESGAFRRWRRVPLDRGQTRGVELFAIEHTSPDAALPSAGPIGEPDAAVFALDHAVLQTADPGATRSLYADRLGLRLALDRSFPDWGVRLLFFRVGGITVEAAARLADATDDAAPIPDAATQTDRDQLWGLSWRVRDADAARERLARSGFGVSEVRPGRKPGTRVLTVRDGTCGVPTLMIEPTLRA